MSSYEVVNIANKFIKHLETIERMINYTEIIENKHKNEIKGKSSHELIDAILEIKRLQHLHNINSNQENDVDSEEIRESVELLEQAIEQNDFIKFIYYNIEMVEVNGRQTKIRSNSPFAKRMIRNHLKNNDARNSDINQYMNSLIISLVTGIELLISDIFKDFLVNRDQSNFISSKTLTYSDLLKIGDIEDAKMYLIDEYIEVLLRQSFKFWIEEIDKQLKIKLSKDAIIFDELENIFETIQRRHLLIHNDGIINNFYLSRVHPDLVRGLVKDDELITNKEYILTSIERFRKFGIVLLYNYGLKTHRKNIDGFLGDFNTILLELSIKRCLGARYIYKKIIKNNDFNHSNQLVSEVNYYLSFYLNGEFDLVRNDVEKFNVDTLSIEFKMAKNILLSNTKEAIENFKSYCTTIDDDHFISVIEWPLMKVLNSEQDYQDFVENRMNTIIEKENHGVKFEIIEREKVRTD